MNSHHNAKLSYQGRITLVRRIVEHDQPVKEVAQAMGVSVRTAYKWLARYRAEGLEGLKDRSSRPHSCPHAISEKTRRKILSKRAKRRRYHHISHDLGVSVTTVARVCRRHGLNRLSALDPLPPSTRYEHEQPGDMLHLDIKKLARFQHPGHRVTGDRSKKRSLGAGWEYLHMAIDDHSRIAWACMQPDETAFSAVKALLGAVRYYRSLGIQFKRVLTDNGPCYRSRAFKRLCRRLGLKHRTTRPYTPRTNGKAERWIQTALHEWAYAHAYESSQQRSDKLAHFIHYYNWHRPHASLNQRPPISRIAHMNNLVALHT